MDQLLINKYLRHQQIHWLNQEELFKASVLVVGAGAIGNELLKNLALLGVGSIFIVDFDKIEIHNLTRSVLFSENDIGKYKAEIAKEKLKKINPDCKVESYIGDVYDLNFSFFKNFDCIFSVVDNYEARIRLHQLSFLNQIDFFNSGIDSQYVSAEYFPYSKNQNICLECNISPKVYQNIQKRYSCGWIQRYAFQQKKIPTTIVTSSFAASFLTSLFIRRKEYIDPVHIYLDTISWNFSFVHYQKNNECFFCSNWKNYKTISKKQFYENLEAYSNEITFFCNEPILISLHCPICNFHENLFKLSRKFTDKDLYCKKCGYKDTEVKIQDSFLRDELHLIKNLDWKYLYYFDLKNDQTILVVNDD